MEKSFIDADHYLGRQIYDEAVQQQQWDAELALIKALEPEFSSDGNQYCFLYGNLPNDCVIGFGFTAAQAMTDFYRNFHNQKA